jgi:hypothetical protein
VSLFGVHPEAMLDISRAESESSVGHGALLAGVFDRELAVEDVEHLVGVVMNM